MPYLESAIISAHYLHLFSYFTEPYSSYCLVMARYCPLPGQLCAIARQETIRREKGFPRTITSVRPLLSAYNQGRFARKNPILAFTLHSSQNRLKPR